MKSKTYFTALIKETDDGWFYGQIEEVEAGKVTLCDDFNDYLTPTV